jgi:xylulokinase
VLGGPVSLFGYSPGNIARWLRYTGGAPSPQGADPLGHELYLRNCEPGIYERTATLMEPLDYLALRLTSRRIATPASMIASWLTDNRPGAKPRYVASLVRRSTRDPNRLPQLLPTGSVVGQVSPAAAAELGLAPGAPVVAGVPDLHTACIGSGAVRPYEAHVTISSTAWIGCDVPYKKTDVLHQIASVPGLTQDRYVVANNHETAGLCLRWLKDALQSDSYEELCRLAGRAPAGSGGVIFMPWLAGERSPVDDRSLRGGFVNLSLGTDAGCMVRAVLEGVALNARWLLDAVETFLGRRLDRLRILGGGAESDLWCQIHADVLGRRIEKVSEPTYANLRGAGLYAALALRRVQPRHIRRLVPVDRVFEPDPAARRVYEPLYAEYRRLYGRLRPLYKRLNASG